MDAKTPQQKRKFEQDLDKLSPFEIKNTLIEMAEQEAKTSTHTMLNAGRGNPNWLLSWPRRAFFLLGQFAMDECERISYDTSMGIAASPGKKGIGNRLRQFITAHKDDVGARVLLEYFSYMICTFNVDEDDFAYELVDGIAGDHYPTPDRILPYTELITREYLRWAMGGGNDMTEFDLFATEGSTAGMCYAFLTLQQNFLLNRGDKVALFVPCFTPYLEIPVLDEFGFEIVTISANRVEKNGYHDWQYPPDEIDKLRDPSIKAVCVINPSNPPSVCITPETQAQLLDIVKKDNPKLMVITDDVYGTFIEGFKSLMYALPYNTMCLYSYSKYFGATGWRVAAMCVRNGSNVFDDSIAALPKDKQAALIKRYTSLSMEPAKIKFIDRLVADSRMVGLNHTAGLSTPQQIMMAIFSAYALIHKDELQPRLISMIHERLHALWDTTGFTLLPDKYRAGYYSEIDMMVWAKKFYGDDFAAYLNANYDPLDVVVRLAEEDAVVLLNGDGFDGPKWSVRVSLANLNKAAYLKIGAFIRKTLEEYYTLYQNSKK